MDHRHLGVFLTVSTRERRRSFTDSRIFGKTAEKIQRLENSPG